MFPFRFILVRFSDRGLVLKGSPDLKLFNCLYWISFFTLTFNGYFIFPLSKQLQKNFPENSIKGQICTKIDFQSEQINSKQRLLGFIAPLLMTSFNLRFKHNVSKYLRGQNLKMKTFSQFGGKHHRNIFTGEETRNYFFVCTVFIILDNIVIILLQHCSPYINKTTQFYIHNLLWFVFVDCFFGVIVPLRHLLQSRDVLPQLWLDENSNEEHIFYVRKPEIIPRRYDFEKNKPKDECNMKILSKFSYLKNRLMFRTEAKQSIKIHRKPIRRIERGFHEIANDPLTPVSI